MPTASALAQSSFTRPASPATIGAAIAAAADRIELLPLANIHPSPTNPRKTFEGIEELAASIAEQGLLQPIVVRPMKKDGDFEILAGERRYRALKHLKRETAAAKVVVASDGQARAVQIVENLQREDIKPMDEARAFAQLQDLDHKTWTPQAIAKAIGKTDRFVQQRIQMARNLSPKAQKALADGDLKVEQARTLAIAPKPVQDQLLEDFDSYDLDGMPPNELRDHILEAMVPVEVAAFDIALYKGGFHEENKKRYFTDVEQFNKLQAKAAQELARKLAAEWPGAHVVEKIDRYHWYWGDTGQYIGYGPDNKKRATGPLKIAKEKLTALVSVEQGRVKSVEGVALPSAFPRAKSSNSGGGTSGPARETAEHKRYRQAYNEAVFAAVSARPEFALRVLLMRFIDGTTRFSYDHTEQKNGHEAILPKELLAFVNGARNPAKTANLWTAVKKLKADDVTRMVGQYSARSLSWQYGASWMGGNKKPPEFTALLAAETKAKLPEKEKPKAKKAAKAKPKPVPSTRSQVRVAQGKPPLKSPAARKKAATSRKKS